MLSTTNTITDVKKELESYTFYEYASENDFTTALTNAATSAERLLKRYVSSGWYDSIKAKDKVALSVEVEDHIYYAEIYFIIYEFLALHDRKELFKRKAAVESISQDGVTRSTSGPTGKAMAAETYKVMGMRELAIAGIDVAIRTGRNIFGNNIYINEFR